MPARLRPDDSSTSDTRVLDILGHLVAARLGGHPTRGAQCLVVRSDATVLLVKASYRRTWSLPGGFVERDEDPVDAAVREVLEETGIVVAGAALAVVDERRFHHDHLVTAAAAAPDANDAATPPAASDAWEIAAIRWVTAAELHGLGTTLHTNSRLMLHRLPGGLDQAVNELARTV